MKQIIIAVALGIGLYAFTYKSSEESKNISYKNRIKPFLQTHCLGCHSGYDHNSYMHPEDLTSYENVKRLADSGTLRNEVVVKKTMPPSSWSTNNSLSKEEIAMLDSWISQGSPLDSL